MYDGIPRGREGIACKVRGARMLLPFKPWDKQEKVNLVL